MDFIKLLPYIIPVVMGLAGVFGISLMGHKLTTARQELTNVQQALDHAEEQRDYLKRQYQSLAESYARTMHEQQQVRQIEQEHLASLTHARTVTQEVVREIPTYLPISPGLSAGGDPLLTPGFWLLHNAAASNRTPSDYSASFGADAASVTPQAAAEVIAENYGTCHETSERLTSLQDYVCTVAPESASYCSSDSSSSSTPDSTSSPSADW